MTFWQYLVDTFFPTVWQRLGEIATAPAHHPGMIWILFPMIVTLLLMTFYFGRYRKEELGWNTAFGNAIVLVFVSINLFQTIFPEENPLRALLIFLRRLFAVGVTGEGVLSGLVASAILVYAIALMSANFFHWLPKKLAFFVSSGLPINILAYFGVVFVYAQMSGDPITLDWYLLVAFIVFFLLLYSFLKALQLLEPHRDDAEVVEEAPKPRRKSWMQDLSEGLDATERGETDDAVPGRSTASGRFSAVRSPFDDADDRADEGDEESADPFGPPPATDGRSGRTGAARPAPGPSRAGPGTRP